MSMIDDDEVGLKKRPEHKHITSKLDPKHREFGQTKDLIPNFAIIRNCRLGNGQGGMKSIPRGTTYHTNVACIEPQPNSNDMHGEGSLLLPRSSTGTLLRKPPSGNRVYLCPFRGLDDRNRIICIFHVDVTQYCTNIKMDKEPLKIVSNEAQGPPSI